MIWTDAIPSAGSLRTNGKELVIFSLHMSAYGNSDAIREAQVNKLCGDMQAEYEKGNYVICGGDFNHDLKASEDTEEDRASWAYPFPRSDLPEGFSFSMDFLGEAGKAAPSGQRPECGYAL